MKAAANGDTFGQMPDSQNESLKMMRRLVLFIQHRKYTYSMQISYIIIAVLYSIFIHVMLAVNGLTSFIYERHVSPVTE